MQVRLAGLDEADLEALVDVYQSEVASLRVGSGVITVSIESQEVSA